MFSRSKATPAPAQTGPVPVAQARGPTNAVAGPSKGLLQSSLDIVWSYSRSHAFVGSNLPSSPSFVSRYRRPSWADEGASFASRRPSQGTYSVETGDDAEDEDDEDEGSAERRPASNSESDAISWSQESAGRQAMRKQPSRVRFVSPAPSQLRGAAAAAPADEHTPLLKSSPNRMLERDSRDLLEQTLLSASPPDGVPFARRAPPLVERMSENAVVLDDGDEEDIDVVNGQSTFLQTLFNSVNVLVGVGLLAQPLAFAQAGWILGPIVLLFCSVVTNYTAKILARLLAQDPSLMSYSDIGARAFGRTARVLISILFCLELTALSVALVILFSDSMAELFKWSSMVFKLICFFVVLPTVFMPLRYISYASLIGILSSFALLVVIIVDGSLKSDAPGSLQDPMPTNWGPEVRFPLCFGLMASGFGGHTVMPSIARDMQDPLRFATMINWAYFIATLVYMLAGVLGYLMFGQGVSDEVTRDLYNTPGYPRALALVALAMIAVNPIAKFALSTGPLHDTIEYSLGIDAHMALVFAPSDGPKEPATNTASKVESYAATAQSASSSGSETIHAGSSGVSILSNTPARATVSHLVVKVVTTAALVGVAIVLPGFDRVMAFLGAFAVYTISVIGPIAAHLKINGKLVPMWEQVIDYILIVLAFGMMGTGTVWTLLP